MSNVVNEIIKKVKTNFSKGIGVIRKFNLNLKDKKKYKKWFTKESYKFMKIWCNDLNCTMSEFFDAIESMGISKEKIMQIDDDLYSKLWIYVVNKHHTDKYVVSKENKKLFIAKFNITGKNSLKKELVIPA